MRSASAGVTSGLSVRRSSHGAGQRNLHERCMSKPSGDSHTKNAALVLAPEAPYPLAGGGPQRTASLLQYLANRYELDVIVFREPGGPDPAPAFPSGIARSVQTIELPY